MSRSGIAVLFAVIALLVAIATFIPRFEANTVEMLAVALIFLSIGVIIAIAPGG